MIFGNRDVFSEDFIEKIGSSLGVLIPTLSKNSTLALTSASAAFRNGDGIRFLNQLNSNSNKLCMKTDFWEKELSFFYPLGKAPRSEFERVLSGFMYHFMCQLPVILSIKIKRVGRPSTKELEIISKYCFVSLEKAYPKSFSELVDRGLFERVFQIIRDLKMPSFISGTDSQSGSLKKDASSIINSLDGLDVFIHEESGFDGLLDFCVEKRMFDDRIFLCYGCLYEIFPIFRNCLEDFWRRGLLLSKVSSPNPFR